MTGLVRAGHLVLACADMDARPLFWTTPSGGRDGFEPRAATLVAAAMGLEVSWTFLRWDRMDDAVATGTVDARWCGAAITPSRRARWRFTRPYAAFDDALLVRADSTIHEPSDCAGRRIGAIAASTNAALVETLPEVRAVPFDGSSDDVFADMIDALRTGAIDGFVDDEPAFGGLEESGEFRVAFVAPTQHPWGAALRPGNHAVAQQLDDAIQRAVVDGDLAAEWQRWFPSKAPPSVIDPAAAEVHGAAATPSRRGGTP